MSDPRRRVYLDHNAITPPGPEAVAAVAAAMADRWGNPSSAHAEGRAARAALEAARADVATLVDASPGDVIFTSGGSEANVAALFGLTAGGWRHTLLVSATEHPGVRAVADGLERLGCSCVIIGVDRHGIVDLEELERELTGRPGAVVCLQLANQETGVIQPLPDVVRLAASHDALVHCDAVQAAGRMHVSFDALQVATMALAGHKLGAPPGAGALLVRTGLELEPLLPGSQERHRRGGTENLPAIAGFAAAARVAREHLDDWERVAVLRDDLESRVLATLPGSVVLGAGARRLPNTSCLVLPPPLGGPALVGALDLEGIAVSSGPACSGGSERQSEVAMAMGLDSEAARRTLRVSLGLASEVVEIERLVTTLAAIARRTGGGPR